MPTFYDPARISRSDHHLAIASLLPQMLQRAIRNARKNRLCAELGHVFRAINPQLMTALPDIPQRPWIQHAKKALWLTGVGLVIAWSLWLLYSKLRGEVATDPIAKELLASGGFWVSIQVIVESIGRSIASVSTVGYVLAGCSADSAQQVNYAVDGVLSSYNTNTVAGAASAGPQAFARVLTGFSFHGPDGQVLSQLRQVRQRSRCIWVARVGVTPSNTCFIR